ncbi:MAG: aminotransferase class I/II-fold pyridoxal phosphate-dependent enzyme [Rhodobacteraceae bacterium]|nr:aminotransferase class I/II-fold pyridoxal phosphate-dependent enzyme [Paracoccaceae bacterium]
MQVPTRFGRLPNYTFRQLRALLGDHSPAGNVVDLSIGDPRHSFPDWIGDEIAANCAAFGRYPPACGTHELRSAVSHWIKARYQVEIDPDANVISTCGSREALFSFCIALCTGGDGEPQRHVLIPNPFYMVYLGGAVASCGLPCFVEASAANGHFPDLESVGEEILERTSIAFACTPSNPQGAIASLPYLENLVSLAVEYGFRIFSDECYSEIYSSEPPPGILQAVRNVGAGLENVVVFNSLSKRSNLPGLRSGFVVGGAATVRHLKHFRSYSEPATPVPLQMAAAKAWRDEDHVAANRARYRRKYALAADILGDWQGFQRPQAGLYLWIDVGDGEDFALRLWKSRGVRVVPGAYFSTEAHGNNPGKSFVRVALVAEEDELEDGLTGIRDCL